jgi:hypothetical protein
MRSWTGRGIGDFSPIWAYLGVGLGGVPRNPWGWIRGGCALKRGSVKRGGSGVGVFATPPEHQRILRQLDEVGLIE